MRKLLIAILTVTLAICGLAFIGCSGKDGANGKDGKSAYQIWLDSGNTGTETDFLNWLKGKDGADGSNGIDGTNGITPKLQINSTTNTWEVSYDNGATWSSLGVEATGNNGANGNDGANGTNGANGITPKLQINSTTNTWEVSYDNGATWSSLGVQATGNNGANGKSAYEIWVDAGNVGTEEDFLLWLCSAKNDVDGSLPEYSTGEYNCGDDTYQQIITDTNLTEFNNYLKKLEQSGFTRYDTNTNSTNGNVYVVYNKPSANVSVFVSYTANTKTTKIIRSPLETMLSTIPEGERAVTTTKITVVAIGYRDGCTYDYDLETNTTTECTTPNCTHHFGNSSSINQWAAYGASFLIRLADGRFVVIDGGNTKTTESRRLYQLMLDQSADYRGTSDVVTVAAWILTHPDGDHYGGFWYMFNQDYANLSDKVVLEKIIHNNYSDGIESESMVSSYAQRNNLVREQVIGNTDTPKSILYYEQNCSVIKVHTGQKFYIGEVEFEILYTQEDLFPKNMMYPNDSSLVFMMRTGGKDFLMTGDIEGLASETLVQQQGAYLKCDYIQIMHHGWDDTPATDTTRQYNLERYNQVYHLSQADYFLWTPELGFYEVNRYDLMAKTLQMKYLIDTFGSSSIITTLYGNVDITPNVITIPNSKLVGVVETGSCVANNRGISTSDSSKTVIFVNNDINYEGVLDITLTYTRQDDASTKNDVSILFGLENEYNGNAIFTEDGCLAQPVGQNGVPYYMLYVSNTGWLVLAEYGEASGDKGAGWNAIVNKESTALSSYDKSKETYIRLVYDMENGIVNAWAWQEGGTPQKLYDNYDIKTGNTKYSEHLTGKIYGVRTEKSAIIEEVIVSHDALD